MQNRLPNPQVGPFEPGEMWMSCSFNMTAAAATTSGVRGPADGSKIGVGLLATGQDATNALAVVPEQTGWIAVDSPNGGRSAQGNFVIEIGRVQPGTPVGVLLSLWPNDGPGGFVAAVPVPPTVGLVGGNPWLEVSLDPAFFLVAVSITAGSDGYATISLPDPGTVTPGVDMLVQGIGLPFGRSGAVFAATGTGVLVF